MKQELYGTWLLILMLVLSACGASGTQPAAVPNTSTDAQTSVSTEAPSIATPENGKTSIVGQVLSTTNGQPLVNTFVWRGEVVRKDEGAVVVYDETDSVARTNEQGFFAFENIEPGEWTLMVGDPYGKNETIVETDNPEHARIWEPASGEILDVGILEVALEPTN
ncbi:MAG: carboxypeptidase-like regulatory domain-containing protein [Chloroflexaceae bacterium]|nr:carboxypeptidase-like regulatory domain-containing protein [Chloroflexaceae bacterium]